VLGAPVLTTTHGGYTLLLGNNPAFYREVVRQPWGTAWDGSHGGGQSEWLAGVVQELQLAGVRGEVAQDGWMSRRACSEIRTDPSGFLRACVLRVGWFWNIVPRGAAREGWPAWTVWSVGLFYAAQWMLVVAAIAWVVRTGPPQWMPGLLVIAGFALVHLVYWSDARMRAPLAPLLALLAVRGALVIVDRRGQRRRSPSADVSNSRAR
jgi:hypothetical protein